MSKDQNQAEYEHASDKSRGSKIQAKTPFYSHKKLDE
jgi:hypothetical protein